jgi:NAD(P)-dependent dehydrogenase (short-subunit alcohol dehydrogenase family)
MTTGKVILITGAGSGFGRLTAESAAARGDTVFAGIRDVDGRNAGVAAELRAHASGKIHPVELDVTSDASAAAAVAVVLEQSGGRLDVVVNNAGVATLGLAETFTSAQLQALFDVNVFGPQRVNRAALPTLRGQRSGLLVYVSSGLGRVVMPVMGPYCASKFAGEAMAENYRYELAPVGVDSVIVEPGAYPTAIFSRMIVGAEAERAAGYGDNAGLVDAVGGAMSGMVGGSNPPNPQDVADAILKLIDAPAGERPLRKVVDAHTGDGPRAINGLTDQIQAGMLGAFGMGGLLQTRSAS